MQQESNLNVTKGLADTRATITGVIHYSQTTRDQEEIVELMLKEIQRFFISGGAAIPIYMPNTNRKVLEDMIHIYINETGGRVGTKETEVEAKNGTKSREIGGERDENDLEVESKYDRH